MHNRSALHLSTLLAIALALLASAPIQADHRIVTKMHTDAFTVMGRSQPAADDTTVTWLADGKARTDIGDSASFIYLAEDGRMYGLDHQKKQYVEVTLAALNEVVEEAAEAEGDADMADQMMKLMKLKATVTETDEELKIGAYDCRKYIITTEVGMGMGQIVSEKWTTTDVTLDYDTYGLISNALMSVMPGFDEALAELKKAEGLTVRNTTTTKMMGMEIKSNEELLEFEEAEAPDGIFEVPQDYKKTEIGIPGM